MVMMMTDNEDKSLQDAYSCSESFPCLMSNIVAHWQARRHLIHQATDAPNVRLLFNLAFEHLQSLHCK